MGDGGYGRDSFENYVREKGKSYILVLIYYLARVKPFLPASLLRVGRDDYIAGFEDGNDSGAKYSGADMECAGPEIEDGHNNFIVPDGGTEVPGCFTAQRKDTSRAPSALIATAVRIPMATASLRFFAAITTFHRSWLSVCARA